MKFLLFCVLFVPSIIANVMDTRNKTLMRTRILPRLRYGSNEVLDLANMTTDSREELPVQFMISPRLRFDSNGESAYSPATEHHRAIRKSSRCKIPTVDDARLYCQFHSSGVHCTHTCMFGYRFRGGIQREMRCRYDEDIWGSEFEKCKPFIDCALTYFPGARYKCSTNYMDKGTICEVACEAFEDKEAVPKKTYQCDINGKWKPKLPFCAKAGSGRKLVPPPDGQKFIIHL